MKNNKLYIAILAIASFAFMGTVSAQGRHQNWHQDKHEYKQQYSKGYGHGHGNDNYNYSVDYRHDNRYKHDDRYNRNVYYAPRRGSFENRHQNWAVARGYNYRRHVYFPDYHVFYDARRRGYVYRNRGQWIFSAVIPSIIAGVDLDNARIEYMNNVPLDAYPESYYNNYNNPSGVRLNLQVRL